MFGNFNLWFALSLFLCMLFASEVGFRAGRFRSGRASKAAHPQVGLIEASMASMLSLLLGFTFSFALQNYDSHCRSIVGEATAIGTAYQRTQLLPDGVQQEARGLLLEYLALRIRLNGVETDRDEREQDARLAGRTMSRIWDNATRAAAILGKDPVTGLYLQSINSVSDASVVTDASRLRRLPDLILIILFLALMLMTATLGYSSGLAGERIPVATSALIVLIALVAYMIVDLDRRSSRGSIRASHESLLILQNDIEVEQAEAVLPADAAPGVPGR